MTRGELDSHQQAKTTKSQEVLGSDKRLLSESYVKTASSLTI